MLGIPRGQDGESWAPPDLNQVVNASWHHDEIMSVDQLLDRFGRADAPGLVVLFKRLVQVRTLHPRSVFLLARRQMGDLACDCELPMTVEPVEVREIDPVEVEWLIGEDSSTDTFELVTEARLGRAEPTARAVRLAPEDNNWDKLQGFLLEGEVTRLTITVRGDWVLDEDKEALDGNNIWPGVPKRPSGNGAPGNDWISVIHIHQED